MNFMETKDFADIYEEIAVAAGECNAVLNFRNLYKGSNRKLPLIGLEQTTG